jgi:hypothetical protein
VELELEKLKAQKKELEIPPQVVYRGSVEEHPLPQAQHAVVSTNTDETHSMMME